MDLSILYFSLTFLTSSYLFSTNFKFKRTYLCFKATWNEPSGYHCSIASNINVFHTSNSESESKNKNKNNKNKNKDNNNNNNNLQTPTLRCSQWTVKIHHLLAKHSFLGSPWMPPQSKENATLWHSCPIKTYSINS